MKKIKNDIVKTYDIHRQIKLDMNFILWKFVLNILE